VTDNPQENDGTSEPGRRGPEPATDALRRLEERLDRASRAAERLIAQARAEVASATPGGDPPRAGAGIASEETAEATASSAEAPGAVAGQAEAASASGHKPPPAGWEAPKDGSDDGVELALLAQLIQSLRDLLPPDLQRRLADAVRELLLALRALIDFYLERLERRSAAPAEMEDIPIS
jgi:hypothetical protein